MSLLGALRFALTQNRPLRRDGPDSADRQVVLETPLGSHSAWCYQPRQTPRATLVTLPGLSPLGIHDPRWIKLNDGLRQAGFFVVAPRFKELEQLKVGPATVDQMEAVLLSVLDHPELGAPKRVGICTVSFSGSLSLLAAARPTLSGRVSSVFALGTFCDIRTALGRVMLDPEADPYGRLVLMRNFLEASVGARPALAEACCTLALRSWRDEPLSAWEETLTALPEEDEALLRALLVDPSLRSAHWERMQTAAQAELDCMDLRSRLPADLPPVTLVHGVGDQVIPETESVALAAILQACGVPTRLLLTTTVQHGTPKPLWQQVLGLPAFLWTLAGFFRDTASASCD